MWGNMKELSNITDGSLLSVDTAFKTIKTIESRIEELKKLEASYSKDRKSLEADLDHAKQFIKQYMIDTGLAELEGNVIKYTLSRGNPKLVISDESLVPKEYKLDTIVTTIRKDAIKDQLKMGDEIPGCTLEEVHTLKTVVK